VVESTVYVLKSLEIIKCLTPLCTQTAVVARRDPSVSLSLFSFSTDMAVDLNLRRIYVSYGNYGDTIKIYYANMDQVN